MKKPKDLTVKKILIDMDNTLFDFDGAITSDNLILDPPEMYKEGFFENLQPLPGARVAIASLQRCGLYDVYICTKPLSSSLISYSEKARSIAKHFPTLINKIIMTQNKGMIKADILIDDDKSNIKAFEGEGFHFKHTESETEWEKIIMVLLDDEDRKSTRLNSSHSQQSRMPSSA